LAYTILPNTHTGNLLISTGAIGPYSVAGSNGYTWTSTGTGVTAAPVTINQNATIDLKGEGADIVINGASLKDTLAAIESRLAMLKPAKELEAEWEELKRLGDEYRALEKEIQDKMRTWNTLKNTDL
jgi:hypothetical protein